MTSTRPYLIRAFYDWIVDNNCTPHIVVNASVEQVTVPREYVDNGQIVFNISVAAVQGLLLGDQAIEFNARFGGKIFKVFAPITSILAIYAKENGRGMVFAEEEIIEDEEGTRQSPVSRTPRAVPSKNIKNIAEKNKKLVNKAKDEGDKVEKGNTDDGTDGDGTNGDGTSGKGKGKGKGRGHLTLVK